jgi:hypothetical protein
MSFDIYYTYVLFVWEEFGRKWEEFERSLGGFGRKWEEFGRKWEDFGRKWEEFFAKNQFSISKHDNLHLVWSDIQ